MTDVPLTGTASDTVAVLHVVTLEGSPPDAHLDIVTDSLRAHVEIKPVLVSLASTIQALAGRARRTFESFDHTPQPLIDAWVFARGLAGTVPDNANVLVSDRGGIGGIVALAESQRPGSRRRSVWSVAGAGRYLSDMATYGTTEHVEMPAASEIDWELVQYQCADRVLATSDLATELLGGLGVDATVVRGDAPAAKPAQHRPAHRIYALGPVSRRNRSGDVLRAVASVNDASVVVSADDTPDVVWTGTTWEANRAIRRILGERVARSDRVPGDTDLVVVGDPLMPPDSVLERMRASGVRIAAPAQSAVATRWPDVETWTATDDLVAVISGATGATGAPTSLRPSGAPLTRSDRFGGRLSVETRARRVSVGIPAFGAPTYLDECVASVLAQTEPVHEILIIDDGSRSSELDRALDRWQSVDERISILRQANRGVCVARNTMLEAMRGDAFLLVDQDDVLDPSFVAATATALRSDEGLVAVAAWTEFFGEYSAIEAKPPFDRRVAARENPIVSTAVLVDISVRDRGVRFEPDLAFLYCEDWNFWSQITATGGTIGLVPAPLVKHRVHRASGGFQRTDVALRIGTARALAPLREAPSPTD